MNLVLLICLILVLPYPIQRISMRYEPFKFMGPVINCFIVGFLLTNLIPNTFFEREDLEMICGVMVPLGICCMLFCTDVFKWLKISLKVLLSFLLCIISVMATAIVVFFLQKNSIKEPEVVSAMLTGSYIGGTPNMTAIHAALKQPVELNITMFISDIIASTTYLLLIFTVAKIALKWILPPFKKQGGENGEETIKDPSEDYYKLSLGNRVKYTLITLGLSIACTLVPLGIILIKDGNLENPDLTLLMVVLTVLGVGLSFIKKVRDLPGNFETGDYIFCMFFFGLGMTSDFSGIMELDTHYLVYTFLVLFGSVAIHILLCKLFSIDRDTMIITSVAGIMSPPFIPSVASNLKNRELLVPGITVGIVGLAVGNLLGLTIYKILSGYL